MTYIIDTYEPYFQSGNEVSIHWVGGNQYCIRKVDLEWGLPQVESTIMYEKDPHAYHLYESYEEALNFIRQMQHLNGGKN